MKDSPNGRMQTRRFRRKPVETVPVVQDDLEGALEVVAIDALRGGLADAGTVGRVQTALRAELLRRGLGQARLSCGLEGTTVTARIELPVGPDRVRSIVVRAG